MCAIISLKFDDLVLKDNSKQIYLFVWNHIVWWFLTNEFGSIYKSLKIDQIFIYFDKFFYSSYRFVKHFNNNSCIVQYNLI